MTLEQFAYLAEIIAAFAVIASLIYIGNELRQNTEALQAQSRYNLISLRTGVVDLQLQNRYLLEALHKYVEGEQLSATEQTAVTLQALKVLEIWEWQHGEFRAGTIAREELPIEAWRLIYHDKVVPNAVSELWETRRGALNSKFVQFMEENVVNER